MRNVRRMDRVAYDRVGLPVGIRRRAARPSVAARAARVVDVAITRVQEWLEGPDRRVELVVAYGIIAAAVIYAVAAVVRRLAG